MSWEDRDGPDGFTFGGHPADVDQARAEAVDRLRTASSFIVLTRDDSTGETRIMGGTVAGPLELAVLGWIGIREVYGVGKRAAEQIPDPMVRRQATDDFDRYTPPPKGSPSS